MLTGKQRSYLKALANPLKPVIQLGKEGITDAFINQVDETIEKRELLKIHLLESCSLSIDEAADIVAARTKSEFVQSIGRKFVIYRKNKEKPIIELPRTKKR